MALRPTAAVIFLISAWLGSFTLGSVSLAQEGEFKGRCTKVIDGDTITVLHDGKPEAVRLEGIDAPEMDQEFGPMARGHLSALVLGRTVRVVATGTDKYQRTLARVRRGRTDINLRLVRSGYAWQYLEYSNEKALADAQADAKRHARGLWAQPGAVAPWEHRHAKRPAPATPDSAQPTPTPETPAPPSHPVGRPVASMPTNLCDLPPGCKGMPGLTGLLSRGPFRGSAGNAGTAEALSTLPGLRARRVTVPGLGLRHLLERREHVERVS